MADVEKNTRMPEAAIRRLPMYLRYLKERDEEGVENISSTRIAGDMELHAVQVRKDLAEISLLAGKPRLGFSVKQLIRDLENFLGCNNVNDAVLVGTGGLGKTLLTYEGFKNYGLNIVSAFDIDSSLFGKSIGNVPIYSTADMRAIIQKLNIRMGIITVPKSSAQAVADELVALGIKAIWNFAPIHLYVPDGVVLKSEDLAASLALLSAKLRTII